MSDNEEEPEDVEVPHPWEHSTQERQVCELSPEDYAALQEQCRLYHSLIPFEEMYIVNFIYTLKSQPSGMVIV